MRSQAVTTLLLLSVGGVLAAADSCQAFQEKGECVDLNSFYAHGASINETRTIVESGGDATATSLYEQ